MKNDILSMAQAVLALIMALDRRLLTIDITYNFLYTAPDTIWEVLFAMAMDLIAQGRYGEHHNPLAAALYNRSRLEMAFMDI